MHKRIWSFILTIGLILALTPDTVMAANAERTQISIRETTVQEEQTAPATQPETPKRQAAPPAAVPSDLEGSGTVTDPYRIRDAAQLRRFADAVNGIGGAPNTGICAVLTQNIDLSGVCGADTGSWTPIGSNANPYRGTFDGGSFAVSGLYCQKPGASYAGLFASNAGTIKNLGVAGGNVSAGNYAGGLCGINKGIITGCYSTAYVSGDKYAGGICGSNDGGSTVSVCYNTGAINGGKYVGGICGYNKNAVSDCYNTGTVTGSGTSIGGICGYNKKLLSGCYNTGEVGGGTNYVGSICGYNHSGSTFLNCYYLITGTEKGNYGVGMTQQQFASGEVCWALNEGNGGSVVWKQTCGSGLPAFGGKAVYRTQTYKGDGSAVTAYTNDSNKKAVTYTAPAPYTAPTYTGSVESTGENSGGHTHVYLEPKWDWKKYESAKAVLTCQDCGEEFVLKASIKKEVTEPTCTEDGETVYKASVEKDGITFKDKKVVEKERTGHDPDPKPITNNSSATCTDPEYKFQDNITECYKCSNCNKYFKEKACKNEIPKSKVEGPNKATGHAWKETWSDWTPTIPSSVHPSITLTITCPSCALSKQVTPNVAQIYKIPASCAEEGKELYKATATYGGKTFYCEKLGERILYKLTKHNFKDGKCTVCGKKESDQNTAGTKNTPDSNFENETLTPNETISGDEEPTLPPAPEETPETPTPPEESDSGADKPDTPDISDGSDDTDKPDMPDVSDGADVPDTPDIPSESGNTGTPNPPDVPDNSDGQNTPEAPDKSDGSADTPDISDVPDNSDGQNAPEIPDSTDSLNLPDSADEWNETGTDAIEESAVTFLTTPAVNGAVQAAAKQQGIPLWGLAVLLTLVTGIVLLVILRGKHD